MNVYAISLCYNSAHVIEKSISKFYATLHGGLKITHVLLDQHFPLEHDEIKKTIVSLCERYGCVSMDAGRNLGLHDGFNYVLKQLQIKPEDVVLGFDADSCPITNGWDMAMVTAFLDPVVGWVSLMAPWIDPHIARITKKKYFINQVEAIQIKEVIMNSICAWRGSFLLKTHGLHENLQWYGTLEVNMEPRLRAEGLEWVFLPGWREDHTFHSLQDERYKNFKWWYVHGKFKGDFAEYVRLGCPSF